MCVKTTVEAWDYNLGQVNSNTCFEVEHSGFFQLGTAESIQFQVLKIAGAHISEARSEVRQNNQCSLYVIMG